MSAVRRAAAAVVLVGALAGCGLAGNSPSAPNTKPSGTFRVVTVQVDGRDVRCVTWKDNNAGGITCDWQGQSR